MTFAFLINIEINLNHFKSSILAKNQESVFAMP
jgi:hypothetical protein